MCMIFLGGFWLVFPRRPWRGKPRPGNNILNRLIGFPGKNSQNPVIRKSIEERISWCLLDKSETWLPNCCFLMEAICGVRSK